MLSFFKIFIGVQLLYNSVLVSAAQQSESSIYMYIPSFFISLPVRSPQSIEQSSLSYTVGSHQLFYRQQSIYVNPNLPIYPAVICPLGIHTFVLCDCDCIYALQIGSFVPFFQIPYICINIRYLVLWLTSLCMTVPRSMEHFFFSFLWFRKMPLYMMCYIFFKSIPLLVDIQVSSMSWLL